MLHFVPFHFSASVLKCWAGSPACSTVWPTAMQFVALRHETPDNELSAGAAALALAICDHAVPFPRSASVRAPEGVDMSPTAVHCVVEMHETPARSLVASPGLGLVSLDHFVPFQRSTSVTTGPNDGFTVCARPTAVQFGGLTHETPPSALTSVELPG